jgi:hypothetical protein
MVAARDSFPVPGVLLLPGAGAGVSFDLQISYRPENWLRLVKIMCEV